MELAAGANIATRYFREDSSHEIEIDEVEAPATEPTQRDAVALHTARDGASLIVAVVTSHDPLTADTIRRGVTSILPAYMVPGRVDVLERLPKNDSGEIDRKLLKTRCC